MIAILTFIFLILIFIFLILMFIWFALLDIRIELRQSNNLKDEQNDFLTQIRNKL